MDTTQHQQQQQQQTPPQQHNNSNTNNNTNNNLNQVTISPLSKRRITFSIAHNNVNHSHTNNINSNIYFSTPNIMESVNNNNNSPNTNNNTNNNNNNNSMSPIKDMSTSSPSSSTSSSPTTSFRSISPSKILGNFVNNNNNINNSSTNVNNSNNSIGNNSSNSGFISKNEDPVDEVLDSYLKRWFGHFNNSIRGPPVVIHGTLMFNQLYLVLSLLLVAVTYLLAEVSKGWVPLPVVAVVVSYVFLCVDERYHITDTKRQADYSKNSVSDDPSHSNIKDKINFYEASSSSVAKDVTGSSAAAINSGSSSSIGPMGMGMSMGMGNPLNGGRTISSSSLITPSTSKIHSRSSSSGSSTINNSGVGSSVSNNNNTNRDVAVVPNGNSNTLPNLPSFINFPEDSSSFYRTRPYDNHRRSLPPEYYNQYLNYNLNYKNNIHNQHNNPNNPNNNNIGNNESDGIDDNNEHNQSIDQDDTSTNASNDSDQDENLNSDVPKETKVELSELVSIKKVKSNITHFTKLSSNLEEKLDWAQSPFPLNPPRASHSITVYGQSIVTIGGEGIVEAANIIQFIDIEKGISTTPKVTGAKIAPESIYLHDFCRIGNKFYLFGGMVNGKMSNKVYMVSIIDDSTVHWSQPRISSYSPSPRIGHTLTRYGNKFILFGGFDGENVLNDSHILDPETMTWSSFIYTGNPPSERYGHSTTILGEKMIVFGGTNKSKDLNDINILQLDTNTWIPPPSNGGGEVPQERSFHAAVRVGRNLIIVGGRCEGVTQRDIWSLSYRMQWSKVTGLQISPHSHHGLIKNESKLFICGGKGQNGNILDDVWFANTTNLPISSSVTMISYPDIKIEKEIGKGHFSKVLRGVWKQKEVAVKKLNLIKDKAKEEMMNEFKAEVELLGSLQHPNLVNCYGYSLNPMCIVMEFLTTGNLFELIHSRENNNKLDSTLILQFAFDIARGMRYLHSRNIIHRDLKSSNLLLDKHFNVKIADLGIARETSFTQTMTTIGTVAWTAPEILRHESYNHKADVYSFGIVLWELLTGEEPYAGIPPMNAGILVASKNLRPELPENCDPNWKKLVVWCWAEDPNKRPSFEEITNYLTNTF